MVIRIAISVLLLAYYSHAAVANRRELPVAETTTGRYEGFVYKLEDGTNNTANIFLGIPYAQPPIGDLRFEKSEPLEVSNETFSAKEFQPACASFASPSASALPWKTSEDCLYLNVFAPSEPQDMDPEGLPVAVWIHGGGFGAGGAELYGYKAISSNFLSRGIIFVTVQFRMGMFGFFSTGDSVMPGNMALWDQRTALLWLRENVQRFGGNPKRITLWGQQSGSAMVSALSVSKWTRDLFAQSIQMSGSALSGWATSDSVVGASAKIAELLGCPSTDSLEVKTCLKAKSTEEISSAGAQLGWKRDDVNFLRMQMRMDGDFFEKDYDSLLAETKPKPTIIGFTSQEAMIETLPFPTSPKESELVIPMEQLPFFDREKLVAFINQTIAPESLFGEKTDGVRKALIWFYADRNVSESADAAFYLTRYTQILSDAQFAIPALMEVRKKSEDNWPVYLYLLNYMNPIFKFPVLGTFQTYEMPYLFGISMVAPFQLDENDQKLRQVMVSAMANFIISGNPSSQFSMWPYVTEEDPLGFFDMRPQPVLRDNLMLDRLLFWKNLTEASNFDILRDYHKEFQRPKNDF